MSHRNRNLLHRAVSKVVRTVRAAGLNRLIDEGGGHIVLMDPWMRISVDKASTARLIVRGRLLLRPFMGGDRRTTISLGERATLSIGGDFEMGDGVRLAVEKGATLQIGGKHLETLSGITSDAIILARKNVVIGRDFICAWDVFISDSHWHEIKGQLDQEDVVIGDHVWVAHGSSILKGAHVADGCIVAARSVVTSRDPTPNALLAGAPARVVKAGIEWRRDLQPAS